MALPYAPQRLPTSADAQKEALRRRFEEKAAARMRRQQAEQRPRTLSGAATLGEPQTQPCSQTGLTQRIPHQQPQLSPLPPWRTTSGVQHAAFAALAVATAAAAAAAAAAH